MRVAVTGGGTGGHIYPALAVADALARISPGADVRYVGGTRGMEAEIVPAHGLSFQAVTTRKLRKVASLDTALVGLALLKGYLEAKAFLRKFQPEFVIGTGGYVAAATVLAAARQRIPAVIVEENAVPGRTNLWLTQWAQRVCISFEESAHAFPAERTVFTGVPIRQGVVGGASRAEAAATLGLDPGAFTVLVLGGSQGAQRVNELMLEAAAAFPAGVQVLHQTGARNIEQVTTGMEARGLGAGYHARAYLDTAQIPLAYRAADLMVCRCGASTLAEVTANGLPAVMIPLPTAYADHQTANALAVERAGAGILAPQAGLTGEALAGHVTALAGDRERLACMSEASRKLGRPDAAEHVARIGMEYASGRAG